MGTTAAVIDPLVSEFLGSVGKLMVTGDVRGAAGDVQGKLGLVKIDGNLTGDQTTGITLLANIEAGLGVDPRVSGGIPTGAVGAGSIGKFSVGKSMTGGAVTSQSGIGGVSVGGDLHGGT